MKLLQQGSAMTYHEITKYLQDLGNPEVAEHSQRFFKTGKGEYGYGDIFLGIRVPVIRLAVKKFQKEPITVAEQLLKSELHEVRLFALLLLVYKFSKSDPDGKKQIYDLYLSNTKYVNNWDLVDSSAHHIVGGYLSDQDRSSLVHLAQSESLWERRIAIIATFDFIKNNEFSDTLKIAEILLNDPEDLIHKAVGWMLREVGKRDLDGEVMFLKKHYQSMPRTMLRSAIEKFPPATRKQYLNSEI